MKLSVLELQLDAVVGSCLQKAGWESSAVDPLPRSSDRARWSRKYAPAALGVKTIESSEQFFVSDLAPQRDLFKRNGFQKSGPDLA